MKHFITGLTKYTASILVVSLVACGGADERKLKYLEKGNAYLAEKNYEKAKIEAKNVLQIDPKFAEAYYLMGQLADVNKEPRKALGNYNKAIELDPKHSGAKLRKAKIFVIAGTERYLNEAENLVNEVIKEQPDNVEAKLISATIKYKSGEKKQAISEIESIVKTNSNRVEAISLLTTMYGVSGEHQKAIKLLRKGVLDNVNNIPLRISLAKFLLRQKDYAGAEKYLLEAVAISPERYSLQVGLSTFYSTTGQEGKAEKILRKAIEQDDDDINRYLVLIEMLSAKVSLQKADEEMKKAIQRKPEMYELKFAQVTFFEKIGKIEEAKAVLKQIIADKPYDLEGTNARIGLARIHLKEGDFINANSLVEKVIEEYPNNNDALLISSKLALANMDAITAINSLRTVVKHDPKNPEASLLLAQAHELNKESSLAENELKKSIEANPLVDQTHVNLARYLVSKGRIDEAVSVIDNALVYFKDSYDLMNIKLRILISQNKESEVLALLDEMEQSNKSRSEVNIVRGQYFLLRKNMVKALQEFEKSVEKSVNPYKSLQLIVKTYMQNNQPQKAIDRIQKILNKKPDDAVANLLMGQIYLSQKKVAAARSKLIKATKSAESWMPPYSSLAASYLIDKDYDGALKVYQDALTSFKNKVPALMQIASIYEKKKAYSSAMDAYQLVLAENSNNTVAINNYASLLLDRGSDADVSKALELTKIFEKLQQPAFQDTLGWAYAKAGDSAKAIEILKPIVEKSPKIAVFRYHLGYALYEMGDKAAAKSHLEIASSSDQVFPGKENAGKLLKSI